MKTKVVLWVLLSILIFPIMTKSQEKVRQTAGHDALGEFAPEFAHLNDDILFGEVWSHHRGRVSFMANRFELYSKIVARSVSYLCTSCGNRR